MKKRLNVVLGVVLGAQMVVMTYAVTTAASVINVTTTSDVINASDGQTSLREAVRLANSQPAPTRSDFLQGITRSSSWGRERTPRRPVIST